MRRSATRPRSCTRAGRSRCASSAPTSTSAGAPGRFDEGARGEPVAAIGIFGGAFNPPHLGHLVCAQEAWVQLGLERVLLVPVAQAPHREIEGDPGAEERFAMCAEAVAGDQRLEVSRIEIDRGGPSYTVDTLRALHADHPEDELHLILGADQAAALGSWREPEEVLRLAAVAVAERRGVARSDLLERVSSIPGSGDRIAFFDMPRVDISASLLRRRAAEGKPLRYLLPAAVAARVASERLYA
ncbi:MAG: nicotinate (nicotinamide) nucleotide adenylyltransferase [Thermoleophilaceae bacterium]|nr:nicotinate (nicotinamide) nucleotide adenylyltransferase [Thermoleophilaceae bacterium]